MAVVFFQTNLPLNDTRTRNEFQSFLQQGAMPISDVTDMASAGQYVSALVDGLAASVAPTSGGKNALWVGDSSRVLYAALSFKDDSIEYKLDEPACELDEAEYCERRATVETESSIGDTLAAYGIPEDVIFDDDTVVLYTASQDDATESQTIAALLGDAIGEQRPTKFELSVIIYNVEVGIHVKARMAIERDTDASHVNVRTARFSARRDALGSTASIVFAALFLVFTIFYWWELSRDLRRTRHFVNRMELHLTPTAYFWKPLVKERERVSFGRMFASHFLNAFGGSTGLRGADVAWNVNNTAIVVTYVLYVVFSSTATTAMPGLGAGSSTLVGSADDWFQWSADVSTAAFTYRYAFEITALVWSILTLVFANNVIRHHEGLNIVSRVMQHAVTDVFDVITLLIVFCIFTGLVCWIGLGFMSGNEDFATFRESMYGFYMITFAFYDPATWSNADDGNAYQMVGISPWLLQAAFIGLFILFALVLQNIFLSVIVDSWEKASDAISELKSSSFVAEFLGFLVFVVTHPGYVWRNFRSGTDGLALFEFDRDDQIILTDAQRANIPGLQRMFLESKQFNSFVKFVSNPIWGLSVSNQELASFDPVYLSVILNRERQARPEEHDTLEEWDATTARKFSVDDLVTFLRKAPLREKYLNIPEADFRRFSSALVELFGAPGESLIKDEEATGNHVRVVMAPVMRQQTDRLDLLDLRVSRIEDSLKRILKAVER